jgi:hypothetical protein
MAADSKALMSKGRSYVVSASSKFHSIHTDISNFLFVLLLSVGMSLCIAADQDIQVYE